LDPHRENVTQRLLRPEYKPQVYWSRSDEAEGSGLDTFEQTRPKFQSWEKKIEVEIDSDRACEDENILIRTRYRSKPLPFTQVKLYSHGGGREYISEITTDENGWGVFGEKPLGKYDFVARKENYNEGQKIFSVDMCLPEIKQQQSEIEKKENVDAVVYAREYERRYIETEVGGGILATKVRIKAIEPQGEYVIERIPRYFVEDKNRIGFEENYPQIFEQDSKYITLGWKTDGSLEFVREYVIMTDVADESVDEIEFYIGDNPEEHKKVRQAGIIESILAMFGLA